MEAVMAILIYCSFHYYLYKHNPKIDDQMKDLAIAI